MKRYQKIDIFRLYCALLVVLIHVLEIQDGHPIAYMLTKCFAGQAVPFFFIVSGFFLAKKLDTAPDPTAAVRSQAKHNLLLYAAWMVIEFPGVVAMYNKLYPDASIVYHLALIIRRIFFAGQGVYWFLLVLAEAILLCGILLIHKKERLLYGMAAAGLLLQTVYRANISVFGLGYVNTLFEYVFSWDNNVVMTGLPFVTIGILFARNETRLSIASGKLLAVYGVLGAASMSIFALSYRYRPDLLYLLSPGNLQAILLFLIALQPGKRPYSGKLCSSCRDLSTCLYYLHTIFIYQVANLTVGLHAPVLLRYAIASLPPVAIWFLVRRLDWKPAKWMLSMK